MDPNTSQGNLYKFPKDVLIKMLMTIEEETKIKCERDHDIEIKYMLNLVTKHRNVIFATCDYENCQCFLIYKTNRVDIIYMNKDIPFYECTRCHAVFCENHKGELSNFNETTFICNKCCRNAVM